MLCLFFVNRANRGFLFMNCLIYLFMLMPVSLISFEMEKQHSVSEYLHSTKIQYQADLISPQNLETIHFVMGNESADLDSIISSIAYAYLLHMEQSPQKAEFYIPLMNISRAEIALRKDVLYLFDHFHICVDDILFLDDDVQLDALLAQNRLRLNLVDHNSLKPKQKHLCEIVERIVDHHHDEKKDYPLIAPEDKVIDITGSNATLIAEKFLFSAKVELFPELAGLLLAPVLADTSNLRSIEKTTSRDVDVATVLNGIAAPVLPGDFYHHLMEAKHDVAGLTPAMILSKDFKEYVDGDILYGISSLPSSVRWGLDDLQLVGHDIHNYAKERNLDYLILLMSCDEPQSKRKILVYSSSNALLKAFDAYVQKDDVLKGLLLPDGFSEKSQAYFYKTEKSIARKQLQPLFYFRSIIPIQKL